MKHYIVVLRNEDGWVIGPFETQDAASEWADKHWKSRSGDPRWQVVALPDSKIGTAEPLGRRIVALALHAPENAKGLI